MINERSLRCLLNEVDAVSSRTGKVQVGARVVLPSHIRWASNNPDVWDNKYLKLVLSMSKMILSSNCISTIWTMVIKRCSAGVFSPSGEVLNKPWVELLEYVGKGGDSLPVAGLSNRKRDSPAFNTIRNPLHDIPYSTVPVLLSCLEEVGSKGTSWTNNTVSWNFPFISCPNHTGMT